MMPPRTTVMAVAGWAALGVLCAVIFCGTLSGLFARWWSDPTYSHGLLVPAVTLFFLYDRRDELRKITLTGSLWGAVALLAALALYFVGRVGNMLSAQAVAFVGALGALSLLVGGWRFFRVTAFPILFLLFMCPLPSGLYGPISAQLRLFASSVATVILQMLGVEAARLGNIIRLAGVTLSVEDACSGIRSLFGITATATAFAFIMPGGWLRRAFFIVSALPIAILSNILRVAGTGLLYEYAGARFAEGFYHSLEGWVFYVVALAGLFFEFFIINTLVAGPRAQSSEGCGEASE